MGSSSSQPLFEKGSSTISSMIDFIEEYASKEGTRIHSILCSYWTLSRWRREEGGRTVLTDTKIRYWGRYGILTIYIDGTIVPYRATEGIYKGTVVEQLELYRDGPSLTLIVPGRGS